jgi:hypothetical protein
MSHRHLRGQSPDRDGGHRRRERQVYDDRTAMNDKKKTEKNYSKGQARSWSKSPWMKEFRDQTEGHGYEEAEAEENRIYNEQAYADVFEKEAREKDFKNQKERGSKMSHSYIPKEWVTRSAMPSLYDAIHTYGRQLNSLKRALTELEELANDIQRQKTSLAKMSLQKFITFTLRIMSQEFAKLKDINTFMKKSLENEVCMNPDFFIVERSLLSITSKLQSLFQQTKEKLEITYCNTALYDPESHWQSFCESVDKLGRIPRSRDSSGLATLLSQLTFEC